jgi:UDP-N-acetylmuramyl tripeptide synthase
VSKLRDLLDAKGLDPAVVGLEATGLCVDSRKAKPGDVFFALAGAKSDGLAFVGDAIARGASIVVAEREPPMLQESVGFVRVVDARAALARAASRFFPRQPATIVAVTGTSGKTSVAEFTRQIWRALGFEAASLGTIGIVSPKINVYGALTTPDPIALHRTLDQLAGAGVTHLAMEASSHGLDQKRLDGVRLIAGAFTNLSRDHLDYHGDAQSYLTAKLRLFDKLLAPGAAAVVDADGEVAGEVVVSSRSGPAARRSAYSSPSARVTRRALRSPMPAASGASFFPCQTASRSRMRWSRRPCAWRPAPTRKKSSRRWSACKARPAVSSGSARRAARLSSSIMRISPMRWTRLWPRCVPL